jgi:hypothetical protein
MPSLWPLCAGLFWILIALLCGWIGVFYPRTSGRTIAVAASPSQWPRSMTPTEARVWLLLWTVMGLSLVGQAVTIMRHTQRNYVVIPASAPFIDRAIWVVSWVCLGGGFCVLVAWSLIVLARARREWRSRR